MQHTPGLADFCRPTLGIATHQNRTQNGFGRTSIPEVSLVIINIVFPEQTPKFILNCTILSGLPYLIVYSSRVAEKRSATLVCAAKRFQRIMRRANDCDCRIGELAANFEIVLGSTPDERALRNDN
jgi:hypothetical protein